MKPWGFWFSLMLIAGGGLFSASEVQAANCNPDTEPPTISNPGLILAECRDGVSEVTLNPNGDGTNTGDFQVSDFCQAIVIPSYDNGWGGSSPCTYPTAGSAATCAYPLDLNGNAGLYIVAISASDSSGNQATQTAIIQVADTQPPLIRQSRS